ncbi:hypothetical protein [Sphingomicrobium astaxanthinifaciens]|uniref:hypothetical protein n=1 Tax=Sphingomicrobium astaxanthinifaciens TaxID=1227949 RepID=UPI001FCAD9F6|nr:hypothetical protein [Sphingomicrobium astaxanthinifaciens]MCJ7420719.1 hypothetical protein [Sphingomicrobium astaxanthinifaciens]
MQSVRPARWRPIVVLLAPLLVLVLARAMTHSDWAAANASLAALLFAWLVADTLGLLVLAKAPRDRHGLRALLGALTLASLVILVGASAPVRAALLAMPPLLVAMAAISALWLGWSAARFVAARRDGADLEAGFATILLARLVHAMAREAAAMRLALFGWGLAPDVPAGASAHAYHRYLPNCASARRRWPAEPA